MIAKNSITKMRSLSLLLLVLCCSAVNIQITAAKSDLAQKLIDTIKANYLEKQHFRRSDHDGYMPPKDKREDEVMRAVEALTPADMERLEEELSKLQPMDEWLREQVRSINKQPDYKLVRLPGGYVDTPLGNITELCYNDTVQMVEDFEKGDEYAVRIGISWGLLEYFLDRYTYTGKIQEFGIMELCLDNNVDGEGSKPYPFNTHYCQLDVLSGLKIGTCWSTSCSEAELTEIAYEYLGWLGIIYLPWYMCEMRNVPWYSGAIATISVISFLAAIVLAATIYHLTCHRIVKGKISKCSQRQRKKPVSNGRPIHVYSQDVGESMEETRIYEGPEATTKIPLTSEQDAKSGNTEAEPAETTDICKLTPEEQQKEYGSVKRVTIEEGHVDIVGESEADKKIRRFAFIDKLLLSSSMIFNANKYMDCTVTSPTTLCLNGLRTISMWWIILGHSALFLPYVRLDNNWAAFEQSGKITARAVMESNYGVDTFFFLSGLLLSYITLKQLAKGNGKINWLLFYFHRIWRITPTYMLILAVYMNLFLTWGQGPSHDSSGFYNYEVCKRQWWHHLLYINNLYPFPGSVVDNVCMGWTWYLADDMQFFIISPFILYLLYRFWKAGILTIVVLLLASFGSTIYLTIYWGIGFANTGWYNDRAAKDTRPGDDYIYAKPWHRIPPYLIGILFGYMLYKLNGRTIRIGFWKNILGWNFAAGTAWAIIYCGYFTSEDTPQWAAVVFNTLSRTLFALSIAWVAFSCIMGYGGLVNQFLSWSIWIPLGRLSFGAYLLHPAIMIWVIYTRKTLMHWSYVDFSYFYVGNIVFSYAVAFIFVLLVEGPTSSLEEALLGGRRRGTKEKNK